jgi:shikimate dehydrogenase
VIFAVFGLPVAHSLSPVMHRAALAHVGLGGDYLVREVDATGFIEGIAEVKSGQLDGANVTMPHKSLAYRLCDRRSERSDRAGAVNTLSCEDGRVIGDNTDVAGIRTAWRRAGLPQGAPVTVLGAGGAAAAALVALAGMRLQVMARDADKARAMIERTGVTATVLPWGETPGETVIVNATPLGMRGEVLGEALLQSATGLLDMAYGDTTTPAVATMRASGRPVAEGLDMLVGQAVASFHIWTGIDVDPEVMRAAARAELSRRRQAGS